MNNTWFGNKNFEFDGRVKDVISKWCLCLVLVPFTLGLSLIWYAAFQARYFAAHTRFEELEFDLSVKFGDFLGIYFRYFVAIAALGLFWALVAVSSPSGIIVSAVVLFLVLPVLRLVLVTHSFLRLTARRLQIKGENNLDLIVRNAQVVPNTGEGLASALDIGGAEIGF